MTGEGSRILVWVTVGKTDHHAWLLSSTDNAECSKDLGGNGESNDSVLIKWGVNGITERVSRSSVHYQMPSRRRSLSRTQTPGTIVAMEPRSKRAAHRRKEKDDTRHASKAEKDRVNALSSFFGTLKRPMSSGEDGQAMETEASQNDTNPSEGKKRRLETPLDVEDASKSETMTSESELMSDVGDEGMKEERVSTGNDENACRDEQDSVKSETAKEIETRPVALGVSSQVFNEKMKAQSGDCLSGCVVVAERENNKIDEQGDMDSSKATVSADAGNSDGERMTEINEAPIHNQTACHQVEIGLHSDATTVKNEPQSALSGAASQIANEQSTAAEARRGVAVGGCGAMVDHEIVLIQSQSMSSADEQEPCDVDLSNAKMLTDWKTKDHAGVLENRENRCFTRPSRMSRRFLCRQEDESNADNYKDRVENTNAERMKIPSTAFQLSINIPDEHMMSRSGSFGSTTDNRNVCKVDKSSLVKNAGAINQRAQFDGGDGVFTRTQLRVFDELRTGRNQFTPRGENRLHLHSGREPSSPTSRQKPMDMTPDSSEAREKYYRYVLFRDKFYACKAEKRQDEVFSAISSDSEDTFSDESQAFIPTLDTTISVHPYLPPKWQSQAPIDGDGTVSIKKSFDRDVVAQMLSGVEEDIASRNLLLLASVLESPHSNLRMR